MPLTPGTRLGPYEIAEPLGAGGMGEVYRARDTRLGRDVALKTLPGDFARNPERLARFRREAQVLASLNHPNIAQIHGFEESGGTYALVMELVEGPTLAERIARGPIPMDEALPIARQVAGALEAAHDSGVIHRDLKPANIKVREDGTVKVLDFGLAKALEPVAAPDAPAPNASMSPTITTPALTRMGVILGTAAYMSPEQAKGLRVDRRADVWAFGCVLYEMLTGRRPFEGETISDVLAAVIRAEPEWTAIPGTTPPSVQRLVRRCLQKDQRQRLQAIGDARIAIEETISGAGEGSAFPAGSSDRQEAKRLPHRILPWATATGLVLLLGMAAGWWAGTRRSSSTPGWSAQMLGGPSVALCPRISPDGHTLAFAAMVDGLTQVAVMDTHSGDWTVLTKDRSRGYAGELNWSPDGSEIYFDRYFSSPHGIYAISRLGGDVRLVLDDAMAPQVLPDGSLIVIRVNEDRNYQLYRFWPDSGRLDALGGLIGGFAEYSPVRAFRDGKEIVFLGRTLEQPRSDASDHLYAMTLASGETRRLAPEVEFSINSGTVNFPIAVAGDDRSVLAQLKAGDLYRIVSVPRNGTGPVRTLLSLTLASSYLDADQAGNIYLDQQDRPTEALRFPASGGTPQVLASPLRAPDTGLGSIQLPDGRVVLDSMAAGRSRLVAGLPGGQATPFIQTKEETWLPACLVGEDDIAFLLGSPGDRVVAVASISSGRIVSRLDGVPGNEVTDLAASPDGKTLYYVASRIVWAIAASGGQPRQIGPGDSVAPNPDGKDLIVQLNEEKGVRLMKVPAAGGAGEPVSIQSALRLAPALLSPDAVGKDGRVVLSINAPDSWFWEAAILDPRSGSLDKVPLDFWGDITGPGWLDDGRILSSGWPFSSTIWLFRPADGNQ